MFSYQLADLIPAPTLDCNSRLSLLDDCCALCTTCHACCTTILPKFAGYLRFHFLAVGFTVLCCLSLRQGQLAAVPSENEKMLFAIRGNRFLIFELTLDFCIANVLIPHAY